MSGVVSRDASDPGALTTNPRPPEASAYGSLASFPLRVGCSGRGGCGTGAGAAGVLGGFAYRVGLCLVAAIEHDNT